MDFAYIAPFVALAIWLIRRERRLTAYLYNEYTPPRVFKRTLRKSVELHERFCKELAEAHARGEVYQYPEWMLRSCE